MAGPCFDPCFLCARVLAYWAGMAQVFWQLTPVVLAPERQAPVAAVRGIELGCFLGGLLNAYWMVNIIKMALRGGKKVKA